ncbi:sensor histidine kinase [Cytobacillus massiliigabonensis]|uniref:sensor histidine kinase n=1 Tax=Cytobacillus massiliigabonensis TaxID=1871011 RepID=UPI001F201C95|nr:sensor histidine kinase [Cytobacillus massiliigabonensis]
MLPFCIRFIILIALWALIILSPNKNSGVFVLLFCALSLSIYFLFPLFKKKLPITLVLLAITFVYAFLLEEQLIPFFLLLIFLYSLEAAFYLSPPYFRSLLIGVNIVLLAYFAVMVGSVNSILAGLIIMTILLFCTFCYLNTNYFNFIHQSQLYEQLIDEYRKVKRYAAQNEKAVRMEERTRIAREMHDSVGHKLTALSMQLEILLMNEKNDVLHTMKDIVNESLEETRKAVRALNIDDVEGISSVIQLIRKLESESHLRVHFTTKQGALSVALSNQNSIVLYRVLQESLTNAMKYGQSREVFVTLGTSPLGHLYFDIRNSYDHIKPFHEGFGLKNMRQRVEEVGGSIEIYQLDQIFIIEGSLP